MIISLPFAIAMMEMIETIERIVKSDLQQEDDKLES